jgi:hypothetical protein
MKLSSMEIAKSAAQRGRNIAVLETSSLQSVLGREVHIINNYMSDINIKCYTDSDSCDFRIRKNATQQLSPIQSTIRIGTNQNYVEYELPATKFNKIMITPEGNIEINDKVVYKAINKNICFTVYCPLGKENLVA